MNYVEYLIKLEFYVKIDSKINLFLIVDNRNKRFGLIRNSQMLKKKFSCAKHAKCRPICRCYKFQICYDFVFYVN